MEIEVCNLNINNPEASAISVMKNRDVNGLTIPYMLGKCRMESCNDPELSEQFFVESFLLGFEFIALYDSDASSDNHTTEHFYPFPDVWMGNTSQAATC